MSGKSNKTGFTFLEVMVVMGLIALLATIGMPLLFSRKPRYERELFFRRLNALTQLGWQNALITHKIHKISFDFASRTVRLLQESPSNHADNKKYVPLKRAHIHTTISWPKQLDVKQFFVEGSDEFASHAGRSTAEVWFFIVPEGLAQQVTINMLDTKDKKSGKPRQVGLVLNPFSAQFVVYDTWQKS